MAQSIEVYAFLDSSYLMHFQRPDSVDWCKHLQSKHVTLVIDQQVLRELNDLKDGAYGKARRDKARDVSSFVVKQLEAENLTDIRQNVAMIPHLVRVNVDFLSENLDERIGDDWIIAGMMTFRLDFPDARILLVSNDGDIRLKARAKGFQAWDPVPTLKRIDLASEDEKELRKLQQEVQSLRNKQPNFWFGILLEDGISEGVIVSQPKTKWRILTGEEVTSTIEREKQECLDGVIGNRSIEEHRIKDYFHEVEDYIDEFEEWLKFTNMIRSGFELDFRFALKNDGTSAHRVNVEIVASEALLVEELRQRKWIFEDRGEQPARPKRPGTRPLFDNSSNYLSISPRIYDAIQPIGSHADVETIYISGKTVVWKLPVVRNGEDNESDKIWMVFPGEYGREFKLEYAIMSTEGIESVEFCKKGSRSR